MKSKTPAKIMLLIILVISTMDSTTAYADHMITNKILHTLMVTPTAVFGKTYSLDYENKTFSIYYGFNSTQGKSQNISVVQDHNSIQIILAGVTDYDAMWIQFPDELISADKNNFVLYVNGQERGYELATTDHSIIMGFMVPAYSHNIEIKGTRVIPEFGPVAGIVIGAAFIGMIISRKLPWR
jgi:hypothetical protein